MKKIDLLIRNSNFSYIFSFCLSNDELIKSRYFTYYLESTALEITRLNMKKLENIDHTVVENMRKLILIFKYL